MIEHFLQREPVACRAAPGNVESMDVNKHVKVPQHRRLQIGKHGQRTKLRGLLQLVRDLRVEPFHEGTNAVLRHQLLQVARQPFAIAGAETDVLGQEFANPFLVRRQRHFAKTQILGAIVAELGAVGRGLPAVRAKVIAIGRVIQSQVFHGRGGGMDSTFPRAK